ncbi:MAG: LCP family protein [Clostridia bacterium]|nr:LCP family protein [Clostridia bacterium]
MGKYEAAPKHVAASGGGKKRIGLWIALAVLAVLVVWGIWFFTTPPEQKPVEMPPEPATAPTQPSQPSDVQPTQPVEAPPTGEEERQMKKGWYTILLAGTMDGWNADTMMLCSIDSVNGKVKLVSVNRDTQVDAPIDIPKLNAMYGWKKGGDEGAATMCAKITELTGVPINQYVVIGMEAFKEIIDMIGGVDYNVPFDMYHKDLNQDYHIDVKAGQQTLSGSEALQFVRFRSTSENDFGRVNRQKEFLIATMKQVLKKFSLTQIEGYIEIFNKNVVTNMSVQDMVWYFTNVVSKLDFDEDVTSDTLPYAKTGYWTNENANRYKRQSYVYLDPEQIVEYVNENLNPYTTDITTDELNIPHWIDN